MTPPFDPANVRHRVRALVDRFLEHARIFYFRNGGTDEVFGSSADWMPRNFRRRVEVMYPILDESLKRRVIGEVLGQTQKDNVKAWALRTDGSYARITPKDDEPALRSQQRFMELTRERARENDLVLSGLSSKSSLPGPARTLDKLRRREKKKKRRDRAE